MKKFFRFLFAGLVTVVVLAAIVVVVRMTLANGRIAVEAQAPLPEAPYLKPTTRLEILPLYENASVGGDLTPGAGVSYLIRTDSATLLLDVGNNNGQPVPADYEKNMQALGISWDEIDALVISHPHPDHVGSSQAWIGNTLHTGGAPDGLMIYTPVKSALRGTVFNAQPFLAAPDIATTGVLSYPEVFPLSLLQPKGSEQALVVNLADQGLVLITGCGHPGLERLVERAEAFYDLPVTGVVGGLHYQNKTEAELQPQIEFLQARPLQLIALSPHDSFADAGLAFQSAFGERYVSLKVGESVQLPRTSTP